MNWREKIVVRRHELNLSQADLSRRINLQQQRIHKWEKGEGMPSMEQGLSLARALDLPYDYFADDAQERPASPELAPGEGAIIQLFRALGLTVDEALRRLATPPIPTGPLTPGPARKVSVDEVMGPLPLKPRRPRGDR